MLRNASSHKSQNIQQMQQQYNEAASDSKTTLEQFKNLNNMNITNSQERRKQARFERPRDHHEAGQESYSMSRHSDNYRDTSPEAPDYVRNIEREKDDGN